MKYAVDKIEENVVVLENLKTKEKCEVNAKDLPFKVKDGDVLMFDGKNYIKDESERKSRIDIIREKMERVKKQ